LQAEGKALLDEEKSIVEWLKREPPPGDLKSHKRKTAYYLTVAILLTLAGFVFTVFALDPFRFGLKAYLYAAGTAVVTPFLVDFVLERWLSKTAIKSLGAIACVAGLVSLILLAAIRGDLMADGVKNSNPVITFDDAEPQTAPTQNDFYEKTIPLLQLVMILLAGSMELGAGLAIHEVWRLSSEGTENWNDLRKRLKEIHERMGALASDITVLKNEPEIFYATFWKSFYRAMLTNMVRSMIAKGLILLLAIAFVAQGSFAADSQTFIIIAVDLSRSVDVRGPDGKTEFQKNIGAVTKQLAQVPRDSRVTIIGITDHSFTQPLVLLSATIPADTGYFGERLTAARNELARTWISRSKKLAPSYEQTDIIGALALAGKLFAQFKNSDQKRFVIFSDMRHSTSDLNIENKVL
jgi:hypothetical protein